MKTRGRRPGLRSDLRVMGRGWRWFRRPLTPRSVEPLPLKPREYPTGWARTEAGTLARTAVQRFGLAPLMRFETRPSVEGVDVLDAIDGPVIFIANHSSHLDAPLVLTSLPRRWAERTATGAAADYFFDVWWRAAATALVFNAFPVERARSRGRATALARELLADGWSILMFPEGTRSPDGWVSPFRLGAARLAVEEGVPVVPIALRGSYQAMPKGAGWVAKGRPPVHVRFGQPVVPVDGEKPADFSDRMRAQLERTLQEDRTSWWDAQRRAASGGTQPVGGPEGAAAWRRTWEASRPVPASRRALDR